MIGAERIEPNAPVLLIVNVPLRDIIGGQLARPGAGRKICDRPSDADDALLIGVFDHRDDQTVFEVDGDPDVDPPLDHDPIFFPSGVEDGILAQCFDRSFDHKGQVGEVKPFPPAEILFNPLPPRHERRDVDLDHGPSVGHGAGAVEHPLGDGPPHTGDREHLIAIGQGSMSR